MNVVAVDDEELALSSLLRVLKQVFPNAQINGYQRSSQALSESEALCKKNEKIDYAFLDVEMRGIGGIELAKRIKDLCPTVRILFVSAYNQYACEAFQLHAKGYILKPATKQLIEEALDSMEVEWREEEKDKEELSVNVHTFGNFEVFVNDEILTFERSKSKELLAYLIDRKGAGCTTAEIAAVLWEDSVGSRKATNNAQQVIHSMMRSLKEAGISQIVIKKWNYLAINPKKVNCDYYQFLEGKTSAVNAYMGEYMSNYSWAEMTTAALMEEKQRKK